MPEHIPYTNCSQQGVRIRIPDQSGFCFTGLQYYNSNLCSHQGTLFTRTFLSTASDWVAWVEKCRSGRLGRGGKGHSLSGKWKTRRLAAETEMKPNGTRKTNLQNENAKHSRWRGAAGGKASIPTVFVWRFACHRVRRILHFLLAAQTPILLTHQISLLSPWLPLVLFIAFLTLFFGTRLESPPLVILDFPPVLTK
uniref:MIP34109p1 n=1 Tax=Drosophila melanogaster TaxID=7227 RepID=H5V8C7_DROME|nr:MIP34109p1 [Drosophila melanogaster]